MLSIFACVCWPSVYISSWEKCLLRPSAHFLNWVSCFSGIERHELLVYIDQFSSVQFILSVMSDSLWLHRLQQARLPCPSPTPGAYPNSCPLSQWCYPTNSSSVVPFSFCLESFPASGSFPMSQLFTTGGQSIGASASASVLPINIQDWFPLGLVWSPCCPRGSLESSLTPQFKGISSSALSFFYGPPLT